MDFGTFTPNRRAFMKMTSGSVFTCLALGSMRSMAMTSSDTEAGSESRKPNILLITYRKNSANKGREASYIRDMVNACGLV